MSRTTNRLRWQLTGIGVLSLWCQILWFLLPDSSPFRDNPWTLPPLNTTKASPRSCCRPLVEPAVTCLNLSTPGIELKYPDDAKEHFLELRRLLRNFSQTKEHVAAKYAGYAGPWIENVYIDTMERLLNEDDFCLSDFFGPYIPILVPFVDVWVSKEGGRCQFPDELLQILHTALRPDVPYVVVSQSDTGISGNRNEFKLRDHPNILVLSAGGYGHVPIPLLKQTEHPVDIPVASRAHNLSYVGSLKNFQMRYPMHETLSRPHPFGYQYYYGNAWQTYVADSKFSLVPRGYGRTAYHLMEVLQSGRVPVYVHDAVPWIPYGDVIRDIVVVTSFAQIETLQDELSVIRDEQIEVMEAKIREMRDSHFTYDAAMKQIQGFLQNDGTSDLVCQKLPSTIR